MNITVLVIGVGDDCGKSEVARLLAEWFGSAAVATETNSLLLTMVRRMTTSTSFGRFGDVDIKKLCRPWMCEVGDLLTAVRPDILFEYAVQSVSEAKRPRVLIVAGVRRKKELAMIVARVDVVIYVDRPGAELGNCDISAEEARAYMCDREDDYYRIDNNGDLDELKDLVHVVAERIWDSLPRLGKGV